MSESPGEAPGTAEDRPAGGGGRVPALAIVVAASVLLFARLGHYALWDDEALTALAAEGVWRTGDTTAVVGHNLVAYRGGRLLKNLNERWTPPLPAYLAAPFLGLLGENSWAARLPFALCGVACVGLIVLGARRARADSATWVLLASAILGNVSFFLYFRQCRYYGVAILATVALAYLYWHWDGRRRTAAAFVIVSLVLLASSAMNYAALYACLAVDYLLWGRRSRPLRPWEWAGLLAPQVIVGLPLILTWGPFGLSDYDYTPASWWRDKAKLFYWNWRDLNACEFVAGLLLLATPVLYLRTRRPWLLRAPVIFAVYVAALTLISPQPVGATRVANVRYLAPIIPLGIVIGVLAAHAIVRGSPWAALTLGVVAFGTNLLNGGPRATHGRPISTLVESVAELADPPRDPYTEASRWINAHVPAGRSILVLPDYMVYPLIFHAPGPVYAWQLAPPPRGQFRDLDAIHFQGLVAPDYLMMFGPSVRFVPQVVQALDGKEGDYEKVATIDVFWADRFRPELFERAFRPITGYDPEVDAITVLRRTRPPLTGDGR